MKKTINQQLSQIEYRIFAVTKVPLIDIKIELKWFY